MRKTDKEPKQITADSPVTDIKGIGEKTAQLLSAKNLHTVGDLISFYPRDYEYFAEPVTVENAVPGQMAALCLTVIGNASTVHAGGYRITNFQAADVTGRIRLTYFNMPFLSRTIRAGSIHVFRGLVRRYKNGNLQLEQARIYTPAQYDEIKGRWLPVYSLTHGLKNSQVSSAVSKALKYLPHKEDYLPEEDRERLGLSGRADALCGIHFPENKEALQRARSRLVFDEFFTFLIAVKQERRHQQELTNDSPMEKSGAADKLIRSLPYRLTDSQLRAWEEIENDLSGPRVMNRLLQGDVGSGKTILAFLALLMCACSGRQGALMVPTEVLAQQHMESLLKMIEEYDLPMNPVLLTGSVTGRARKKAYEDIASGKANVIIGTHALIQEKLEYKSLGLVITDEQHRFGVRQREDLANKGRKVPLLVMSATPIPRTLAIILYGDLQVSLLTELPKNRLPIKNLTISASERGRILRFMLGEIGKGRQAYIICPAIEESEAADMENVTDYTQKLRAALPADIRVASLNGRMKPAEKEKIMRAFSSHESDILVSTTVIEVGINVPNATVILIENAERFGLSQLHQLRGRVGRGSEQSYCIFLYSENLGEKPERLGVLEKSNDGFHIAEEDLRLRGPGDIFGIRQSGGPGFVLADIYTDADLLKKAAEYADRRLESDPDFTCGGLKLIDFRSI